MIIHYKDKQGHDHSCEEQELSLSMAHQHIGKEQKACVTYTADENNHSIFVAPFSIGITESEYHRLLSILTRS